MPVLTNSESLRPALADMARAWVGRLEASGGRLAEVLTVKELKRFCDGILEALVDVIDEGEIQRPERHDRLRETLGDISAGFAERGLTPSETATFVFALREVLFGRFRGTLAGDEVVAAMDEIGLLIDRLGLLTFETYAASRERIIKSQADALSELSTPVIQLWDGILALPLVGAVDSQRAKEIMENLLAKVVEHAADFVILDITGVPVVDTQVASRLMRTVEAVALLGTRSIITGVNPIVAQTMVQLGIDLSQLTTRATLRAGLKQAFKEMNIAVSPARPAAAAR